MNKFNGWILIGFLAIPVLGNEPTVPALPNLARLVLTAKENGAGLEESFSCHQRIHGYLHLPEPAVGTHVMESKWYNPKGAVADYGRVTLNFPATGQQNAYLNLQFNQDSLRYNPLSSVSMEETLMSYDGAWRVDIYWDGKLLLQTPFHVQCAGSS